MPGKGKPTFDNLPTGWRYEEVCGLGLGECMEWCLFFPLCGMRREVTQLEKNVAYGHIEGHS